MALNEKMADYSSIATRKGVLRTFNVFHPFRSVKKDYISYKEAKQELRDVKAQLADIRKSRKTLKSEKSENFAEYGELHQSAIVNASSFHDNLDKELNQREKVEDKIRKKSIDALAKSVISGLCSLLGGTCAKEAINSPSIFLPVYVGLGILAAVEAATYSASKFLQYRALRVYLKINKKLGKTRGEYKQIVDIIS